LKCLKFRLRVPNKKAALTSWPFPCPVDTIRWASAARRAVAPRFAQKPTAARTAGAGRRFRRRIGNVPAGRQCRQRASIAILSARNIGPRPAAESNPGVRRHKMHLNRWFCLVISLDGVHVVRHGRLVNRMEELMTNPLCRLRLGEWFVVARGMTPPRKRRRK
jgi:hypothetical protein